MKNISLEIDKILYPDGKVSPHVKLERRIVVGLVEHLKKAGFELSGVHDGEEMVKINDLKTAMELIFNVDESHIYFSPKDKSNVKHWVFLVHGNGVDLISDYGYPIIPNGFDEAMTSFKPEDFE